MIDGIKIQTKPCWNCGNTEMITRQDASGHPYYECSKCSASTTKLPQPGQSALLAPDPGGKNRVGGSTPNPIRRVKNVKEKK